MHDVEYTALCIKRDMGVRIAAEYLMLVGMPLEYALRLLRHSLPYRAV